MIDMPFDPSDIDLALAPLAQVAERLRADLASTGQDQRCGECEQPFTKARPVHGVVRHKAFSLAGLSMTHYLVCDQCAEKAKRRSDQGGSLAADKQREHAAELHRLALAKNGGTA